MPPTNISSLFARFLFIDDRYDLFVRESRLQWPVLLFGILYTKLEEF